MTSTKRKITQDQLEIIDAYHVEMEKGDLERIVIGFEIEHLESLSDEEFKQAWADTYTEDQ